jgi:V/A-type H+-transporting ATPase subunit I
MIVGMKKVTLLCLDEDRTRTLGELGKLGVLHLVPINEPGGGDLDRSQSDIGHVEQALAMLHAAAAETKPDGSGEDVTGSAESIVVRIHKLAGDRKAAEERLAMLDEERLSVEPFGDLEPASVTRLAERGVTVKLYRQTGRGPTELPEGTRRFEVSRGKTGVYFVLIGAGDFEFDAAEEIPLPSRPLATVLAEVESSRAQLSRCRSELSTLAARIGDVDALLSSLLSRRDYLEAREGMGVAGRTMYLQGFCPADRAESLRESAAKHGWGLLVEEPSADDRVPTLIKNPVWVRPLQSLLKVIDILPGYREVDISPVFLLFFSFFFGVLVGDAGYGLIFLVLTAVLRLAFRRAPPEPFRLLAILSIVTIVWGAITGNFFGISSLPDSVRRLSVPWLLEESNLINLCFVVGAVHLTIAHAWNGLRMLNSTRALAQVGWICLTWTMYFFAKEAVLDVPFPSPAFWLLGIGALLVVLFMTPLARLKTEFAGHIMLPLGIIGNFVDVISYIRLFAVGSAGLAVAMAFNDLALGKGIHSIVAGVIAAVILFAGHALNIVLCLVGVLVHGVRLNTLEFSSHIELEWAGFGFKPFEQKTDQKTACV